MKAHPTSHDRNSMEHTTARLPMKCDLRITIRDDGTNHFNVETQITNSANIDYEREHELSKGINILVAEYYQALRNDDARKSKNEFPHNGLFVQ